MGPGGWLAAVEHGAVAVAIRSSSWLYPAIETAHLLGVACLVGAAVLFDLRLLGLFRHLRVAELARAALPVARAGFVLAAATGALLFTTEATTLAGNGAFRLKLLLLLVALVNVAVFHRGAGRSMGGWSGEADLPWPVRVAGAVSLCAWLGALAAGQWIAYR